MSLGYSNLYLYLIIDNFSQDNTEKIIRQAEQQYNGKVKCIFYKKSRGFVSCYLYGFKYALKDGAEYIIEMDGGGSHLPSELPRFISKLDSGYDCVFGSRFMAEGNIYHHPLYRRLLSKSGTILANNVLGTDYIDMTSGYEAFSRKVLENMNLEKFLSRGHIYQTEMRYYCFILHKKYGIKICEIPITYIGGNSVLKLKSIFEAFKVLFRLRTYQNKVLIKGDLH